jgi:hypothetical protein
VTKRDKEEEQKALAALRQKESLVSIRFPYADKYPGGGNTALVDGRRGSPAYFDGRWQGYEGVSLDFTLDLGKRCGLNAVRAGFLENQDAWIFLPASVAVYSSLDGKDFRLQDSLAIPAVTPEKSVNIRRYTLNLQGEARYLRLVARNRGNCPDWHKGAGNKAWLFADEIEIVAPTH